MKKLILPLLVLISQPLFANSTFMSELPVTANPQIESADGRSPAGRFAIPPIDIRNGGEFRGISHIRESRRNNEGDAGALICKYLVGSSGSIRVTLRFGLNAEGTPADGSISVVPSVGPATFIPIPRAVIDTMVIEPASHRSALFVNVHVRSRDVDLVLNFMEPNIRQLSGNVRLNGELVKFASREIDCRLHLAQ